MQDKQKVTLYLPPDLHRQLKIRAAVESDSMTALAQRAIAFYLNHSNTVDRVERHGLTHQIYACPTCSSSLLVRDGALAQVGHAPSILSDEDLSLSQLYGEERLPTTPETDRLVTC